MGNQSALRQVLKMVATQGWVRDLEEAGTSTGEVTETYQGEIHKYLHPPKKATARILNAAEIMMHPRGERKGHMQH